MTRRHDRGLARVGASLLLATLALAACTTDRIALPALPDGAVVLAFGDSLTHGTGAPRGQSYPDRLAMLIGHPVVNAGVPGELSADGLRRLHGVLARHHPALVVLCHGGNDILRRRDLDAMGRNIAAMIEAIRASGAGVVLVGVPKPGLLLEAMPLYAELAARYRVPYEGEILAHVLARPALKSDPVHPNAAGYAEIAGAVAALLERAGAVPTLAAAR